MTPLIVPGLHGSGSSHWQTWLEGELPTSRRVEQPDWTTPDLDRWSAVLRCDVLLSCGSALLIAHSFGCLAALDIVNSGCPRVGAALLVAPADPTYFDIPDTRVVQPLTIPAILVASRNDPWMSFERAETWCSRLGCWLFDAGYAGHINVASGHGPWPEVLDLVAALTRHGRPQFQQRTTGFSKFDALSPPLGISNPENLRWGSTSPVLLHRPIPQPRTDHD